MTTFVVLYIGRNVYNKYYKLLIYIGFFYTCLFECSGILVFFHFIGAG